MPFGGESSVLGSIILLFSRDKSFSGNIYTDSPSMSRKGTTAGLRSTGAGGASDYRYSQRTHRADLKQNVTTIYIPSLDVRVHYISKNEIEEAMCFDTSARDSWMSTTKRIGNKNATLTAWMTLQVCIGD